jgi:hypothetical protein
VAKENRQYGGGGGELAEELIIGGDLKGGVKNGKRNIEMSNGGRKRIMSIETDK